jgi:hypothetical protein
MKGEQMRHSDQEIKEAAARFDRLADELEHNPDAAKIEDLSDLQAVASAAAAVQSAQSSLLEAVENSRAHGRSWNELAVALNVSRQAARQRYGITSSTPKKPMVDRRWATTTRKGGSVDSKVAAAKKVPVAKKAAVGKRGRKTA